MHLFSFFIASLAGCINCGRVDDVYLSVADADGVDQLIDSAVLTMADGSTLEMDCFAFEGSPGGACEVDLVDGGTPVSVTAVVDGEEFVSTDLVYNEAAECGMGSGYRVDIVLPEA